jgi:hypothetical protein
MTVPQGAALPRDRSLPPRNPPPGPSLARLGRELHQVCAHATQPEEIAAALEAGGLNDDIARERYGLNDVFACAEALFSHLPYREPARAAPHLPRLAWALAPRGALYALPGAALAVAGTLLAPLAGAQTALLVAVVFGWGWGQGLASLGYRKSGEPLRHFLRGGALLSGPVAAAVSAGAALLTGQPVGPAALVGAVAGTAFAGFAALLILNRPLLAALVYVPSLGCVLLAAWGGVVSPAAAWLALACAALLPLLVLAERTPLPQGLQLPAPRWPVPLAHAAAGWSCGLFVTVVFGAALWDRLGAAALLPVIVSVGAMEVLSLRVQGRLRALARQHGDLGRLAWSGLRALGLALALYLLVLGILLGLYLGLTQPGGWGSLPTALPAALPLLVYGAALLLGTVVSNVGPPWVNGAAWLLGTFVFLGTLASLPAQPQTATLLSSLAALAVIALGVVRVLRMPTTYR